MKKIAVFAVVLLFMTVNANSQLTKGNWLVGGNGSLSIKKYKSTNSSNGRTTEVDLSPNAGYFFIDKLAGGLKLRLNTYTSSYAPGTQTNFALGPFLRYYFLPVEKRVNVFIEAGDQFGGFRDSQNPETKLNTNTISIMAGPCIYFNSSVGLEFTATYLSTNWKNETGRNSSFQLGLGLQIHLEKDK